MDRIPDRKLPKEVLEYDLIDEALVEIPDSAGFIIELQYPLMGFQNAISKCLVRKKVLDKLIEAKKYLPNGITLKIWDAYRPIALQKELYERYRHQIINEFQLQDLSLKEQDKIINHYVALPKEDIIFAPAHTTGGAIDVTLAFSDTGKSLDMGARFDCFSNLAYTDSYESDGMDETVRVNRRILYNAMTKAGFTNLPTEFWHFDYGNKNWAYYTNNKIIYKGEF